MNQQDVFIALMRDAEGDPEVAAEMLAAKLGADKQHGRAYLALLTLGAAREAGDFEAMQWAKNYISKEMAS